MLLSNHVWFSSAFVCLASFLVSHQVNAGWGAAFLAPRSSPKIHDFYRQQNESINSLHLELKKWGVAKHPHEFMEILRPLDILLTHETHQANLFWNPKDRHFMKEHQQLLLLREKKWFEFHAMRQVVKVVQRRLLTWVQRSNDLDTSWSRTLYLWKMLRKLQGFYKKRLQQLKKFGNTCTVSALGFKHWMEQYWPVFIAQHGRNDDATVVLVHHAELQNQIDATLNPTLCDDIVPDLKRPLKAYISRTIHHFKEHVLDADFNVVRMERAFNRFVEPFRVHLSKFPEWYEPSFAAFAQQIELLKHVDGSITARLSEVLLGHT